MVVGLCSMVCTLRGVSWPILYVFEMKSFSGWCKWHIRWHITTHRFHTKLVWTSIHRGIILLWVLGTPVENVVVQHGPGFPNHFENPNLAELVLISLSNSDNFPPPSKLDDPETWHWRENTMWRNFVQITMSVCSWVTHACLMSIDLVDPCVLSDRVLAISQCSGFAPALLWDDLALYSVSGGRIFEFPNVLLQVR